jgi:hypothetical protein
VLADEIDPPRGERDAPGSTGKGLESLLEVADAAHWRADSLVENGQGPFDGCRQKA